ncbi:MAG: flavin reductase family protein [Candidatus Aenigmarchaeota archaeon]|nr:flavin reductase family protein [Candidatus Aenigmarchaeota archaeon]
MNIEWGSEGARKFATNVGLTTSNGPHGHNIMATEWTHQLSYEPGLIAVCLRPEHATTANIRKTKVFGANICADNQNVVSSVSGNNSGKEVDKIKMLEGLGVQFYKGKKIDVLMVKDTAANFECKVVKEIELGDHIMFVGEVVHISVTDKEPIVLSQGKYWKLTDSIPKQKDVLEKIEKLVEKHRK